MKNLDWTGFSQRSVMSYLWLLLAPADSSDWSEAPSDRSCLPPADSRPERPEQHRARRRPEGCKDHTIHDEEARMRSSFQLINQLTSTCLKSGTGNCCSILDRKSDTRDWRAESNLWLNTSWNAKMRMMMMMK